MKVVPVGGNYCFWTFNKFIVLYFTNGNCYLYCLLFAMCIRTWLLPHMHVNLNQRKSLKNLSMKSSRSVAYDMLLLIFTDNAFEIFLFDIPFWVSIFRPLAIHILVLICFLWSTSFWIRKTRTCWLSVYHRTWVSLGANQLLLVSYTNVFFTGGHLKLKGQPFLTVSFKL